MGPALFSAVSNSKVRPPRWPHTVWLIAHLQTDVIELLVAHGANINARNRQGNSALAEAALKGKIDVARALLAAGADVEGVRTLNAYASGGWLDLATLLHRLTSVSSVSVTATHLRDRCVPHSVFSLRNLTSLIINDSHIASVPTAISLLTDLEHLSLSANDLRSLPITSFCLMHRLQSLRLAHNKLSSLPTMLPLPKLMVLDISHNEFRLLPPVCLRTEVAVNFANNPLLPPVNASPAAYAVFVPSLRELSAAAYADATSRPKRTVAAQREAKCARTSPTERSTCDAR